MRIHFFKISTSFCIPCWLSDSATKSTFYLINDVLRHARDQISKGVKCHGVVPGLGKYQTRAKIKTANALPPRFKRKQIPHYTLLPGGMSTPGID